MPPTIAPTGVAFCDSGNTVRDESLGVFCGKFADVGVVERGSVKLLMLVRVEIKEVSDWLSEQHCE